MDPYRTRSAAAAPHQQQQHQRPKVTSASAAVVAAAAAVPMTASLKAEAPFYSLALTFGGATVKMTIAKEQQRADDAPVWWPDTAADLAPTLRTAADHLVGRTNGEPSRWLLDADVGMSWEPVGRTLTLHVMDGRRTTTSMDAVLATSADLSNVSASLRACADQIDALGAIAPQHYQSLALEHDQQQQQQHERHPRHDDDEGGDSSDGDDSYY